MIVGVALVQVAEECVEALLARQPRLGGTDVSQAPFADQGRAIAGLLQNLGPPSRHFCAMLGPRG